MPPSTRRQDHGQASSHLLPRSHVTPQQRTLRGQNPAIRHPRRRRRPLPQQPSWPQTPEGSTRRCT